MIDIADFKIKPELSWKNFT